VRRSKLQQKKLEDELQALSTAQIGWQVERRKYLDEISSLQDQLSRKDYDMTKLNKEIERWKSKSEERDDLRLGKKSELR
jgi:peptidoglycan hydrolase CwlO-like protein